VVPGIPGDDGPYIFDPSIPGIVGGDPEVIILVPSGVVIEDGRVRVPGADGDLFTDDDVIVLDAPDGTEPGVLPGPVTVGDDTFGWYVVVPDGADVLDGTEQPVVPTVPGGSIVLPDGTIIRPSADGEPPSVGPDGKVRFAVAFRLTDGGTFTATGLSAETVVQTLGEPLVLPGAINELEENGAPMSFQGWKRAEGGGFVGAGTRVTADFAGTYCYSVWGMGEVRPVAADLYVTLDPQGGTGGTASFITAAGADLAESGLIPPSREGYVFAGYYAGPDKAGARHFDGAMAGPGSWPLSEDATLYAGWTPRDFSYVVYSPVIYVTNGVPVSRPGVFDTLEDTAYDSAAFTLAPGSGPLPRGLRVVSGGGLSGTPERVSDGPEIITVTVRATDTATGRYADVEWMIVVVAEDDTDEEIEGVLGGLVRITAIFPVADGGGTGTHTVELRYLEVAGAKSQTILGKVNLDDPGEWADLTEHGLSRSLIEATRAVIPGGNVKDGDGRNYRFFRRRVEFRE
jgi:hypothetical protein